MKNIESMTPDEVRQLERMRVAFETWLEDPVLRSRVSNLWACHNRVMQRIWSITQPFLEINVYSIPGIIPPINLPEHE